MDNENKGEIAVVDDTAAPSIANTFDIVDVDAAKAYMDNYLDLVDALLEESDYQLIGDKKAKKKSAWRKLGTAFNISDDVVKEETVTDENGQIIRSKFYVRATLPNGRSAIGVGSCSIFDKINKKDTQQPSNFILRQRFSNAEHDVPSTAHTRAKSRAIADLIGAGEVSAEELDDEPVRVTRQSRNCNSEKPSNGNGRTRRARRAPAKKPEPEVEEAEVIDTLAKEVKEEESSDPSNPFDELAEKNETLKKAIARISEGGDELTKAAVIDELFGLYDIGTITEDEYFEAKELVE